MKKIIIPFFCAVLFSVPAVAQKKAAASATTTAVATKLTPKDVIDNYFKASGGKEKLEAIKSIIIENTVSVQGMEIKSVTKKLGNKFKSVQSVMGQEMIQLFDGEKGYADQMGTKMDFPADRIAEMKKGKPVDALAFDAANFKEVSVEKLDGKDYNVLTSDKGKFYFDPSTGLLYKTVAKEGNATIKSYMTVDGVQLPADMEVEAGPQKLEIKTTKVVINSGVTDADFK